VGRKGRRRLRPFRETLAQTQLQLERPLRGEAKLEAALAAFGVAVAGRTALDAGAAAGGFTRVLLRHGARRVYAVDAGHGQLLGSLRQDARVVNLEATNLGSLGARLVPEPIDLVTLDLSYLALARAVPQLGRIELRAPDLVALVKPQFELGLERPPEAPAEGLVAAIAGITAAGWRVEDAIESPVRGARGAIEFLLWATRPCARAAGAPATGRCPRGSPRGTT
jgi:23S rRNA (cytidine1920-2'-O)/16S rRNA (cytidine1409-2'-O)-methyltransferase